MLESGVSHANAFLNQNNRLNPEQRGGSLLNIPVSSWIKMLLLFLAGKTLLIDGVSKCNEVFTIFLLCLY